MDKYDNEIPQKVAVLERQFSDFTNTVTDFIRAQGEENNRIYDAISAGGKATTAAFEKLQEQLSSRGRVTGQFVLSLIAVGLSLIVGTCGFVQAYVSGQVSPVKTEMQQIVITAKSLSDAAEKDRLTVTAHTFEDHAEGEALKKEVTRLRTELDADHAYELSYLRSLRDAAAKPTTP